MEQGYDAYVSFANLSIEVDFLRAEILILLFSPCLSAVSYFFARSDYTQTLRICGQGQTSWLRASKNGPNIQMNALKYAGVEPLVGGGVLVVQ